MLAAWRHGPWLTAKSVRLVSFVLNAEPQLITLACWLVDLVLGSDAQQSRRVSVLRFTAHTLPSCPGLSVGESARWLPPRWQRCANPCPTASTPREVCLRETRTKQNSGTRCEIQRHANSSCIRHRRQKRQPERTFRAQSPAWRGTRDGGRGSFYFALADEVLLAGPRLVHHPQNGLKAQPARTRGRQIVRTVDEEIACD